jgi:hypothetical protein
MQMTLSLAFLAPDDCHVVAIFKGLVVFRDGLTRPMASARTRAVGLRIKIDQRFDRLSFAPTNDQLKRHDGHPFGCNGDAHVNRSGLIGGSMLAFVIQNHSHRAGADLGRELVGRLACHGSPFSDFHKGIESNNLWGPFGHSMGRSVFPWTN